MEMQPEPPSGVPPRLDEVGLKPPRRAGWWIHVLLLGGFVLVMGLLGSERAGSKVPALTHHASGLLLTCAVQLAVFGVVFGLAWLASRASSEQLLLRRPGWWAVPLGIAYSVGLRLGLGIIVAVFSAVLVASRVVTLAELQSFMAANRPNVEALVDLSALRANPLYFWLTVTLVSFVVAGLREELWRSAFLAGLRALWPKIFGSRAGQVAAVAVAAVIFGLAHLAQGMVGVIGAGLLGFGLGLIMILHGSIWPAVIAHGMFDATTFGLLPWAMDKLQHLH